MFPPPPPPPPHLASQAQPQAVEATPEPQGATWTPPAPDGSAGQPVPPKRPVGGLGLLLGAAACFGLGYWLKGRRGKKGGGAGDA